MQTVGIITTYRQANWGSVLQAYALQQVIDNMGFQSQIIDYAYPNEFHYIRGCKRSRSWLRNLPGNTIERIKICFKQLPPHRMDLLNRFINQHMRCTRRFVSYEDLHQDPPLYDIYVAGSDQIWNPNTMLGDMSYMLDFAPEEALRISYSSSFASLTIPEHLQSDYRENLSKFAHISVREKNGVPVIKELLGREATVVLDPTLLLDRTHWAAIAQQAVPVSLPDKYILCYMLGYTYNPDKSMSQILHQLQDQYQMPVIAMNQLPSSFHGEEYRLPKSYGKGIEEFLMLMNNASVVASSSFHGTAFALNLGRPVIALTDGSSKADDRISSLMSGVGLLDHIVYSNTTFPQELHPEYDVEQEQRSLASLRSNSLAYLMKTLQNN